MALVCIVDFFWKSETSLKICISYYIIYVMCTETYIMTLSTFYFINCIKCTLGKNKVLNTKITNIYKIFIRDF